MQYQAGGSISSLAMPVTTHWLLGRTPPAREVMAAHLLKTLGIEVYCPMKLVWRRRVRQHKAREREARKFALFPGYIFIGFGPHTLTSMEVLRRLSELVVAYVTIDGINPATVRAAVVEELRARFGEVTTGPDFLRWLAMREPQVGDLVSLIDAAAVFRGMPWRVEQIRAKSAVVFEKTFGITAVTPLDNLEVIADQG